MNNHLYDLPLPALTQTQDMLGPQSKQQAIALAYDNGDYAPRVVAKGRGMVAEQIIARAKQHNVFVHESKDLVALLMQVDLDDHIPPALYQAIAEILAWLYRLEEGSIGKPAAAEQLPLAGE